VRKGKKGRPVGESGRQQGVPPSIVTRIPPGWAELRGNRSFRSQIDNPTAPVVDERSCDYRRMSRARRAIALHRLK